MSDKQCIIIEKLQKHIYAHPFYNWCGENTKNMDVLVIGDGLYASKFVDLCLQTGQMIDKKIILHWCIGNETTKETFLSERPAYPEFVSIDDNEATKECYGTLKFKSMDQMYDTFALDCRYIFSACEDGTDNAEIVQLIKEAGNADIACLAAYLKEDEIKVIITNDCSPELAEIQEAHERLFIETEQVTSQSSISQSETAEEYLYRMAFNTHRIWEGIGNPDYDNIKKHFEDPYNKNSSVSFVLSIPYKLKSVGIHEPNPYVAADILSAVLAKAEEEPDSEEARVLSQLAALEHRRWVLEKIADGICDLPGETPEKYAECVQRRNVKLKDSTGKLVGHPCIVTSTVDTPLITGEFKNHALWDDSSADISQLDELDRMSVLLHRAMKAEATKIKRKNNRKKLEDKLTELGGYCQFDEIAIRNYDRYHFCIKNIMDSSKSYATQFGTYEKMLKRSIGQNPIAEERQAANAIVSEVADMLFAVLECNQYRDYKAYDSDFIKYMPFIMTGVSDVHLCMPLGEASDMRSNNDDYFRSVASATALFAKKITYLYVYEYSTNCDILFSKLKAIRNYFDYRGKSCNIEIKMFINTSEFDKKVEINVDGVLKKAKAEGYIQSYTFSKYSMEEELAPKIVESLSKKNVDFYDGINPLTRSAYVNGTVISAMREHYPYFEFESFNKKFRNCKNCSYLTYLRLSSFVQVEDMFALMNAQDVEFNYQDYADVYEKLWSIYCGDAINEKNFPLAARSWTLVANALQLIENRNSSDKVPCIKAMPGEAEYQVAQKMLEELEKSGFISNLSVSQLGVVSCEFAKPRFKSILTKAGDVLETYVYFEVCKLNWFDDVQTGYKFKWEYDEVTNELDCVLTKGYRSILVECKSIKNVQESFYLILDSIADHFGIGYKKVLIMVTDTDKEGYSQFVSRGKQMGIITISKREELDRIGEILKEIMEDE